MSPLKPHQGNLKIPTSPKGIQSYNELKKLGMSTTESGNVNSPQPERLN